MLGLCRRSTYARIRNRKVMGLPGQRSQAPFWPNEQNAETGRHAFWPNEPNPHHWPSPAPERADERKTSQN
jgi:hypothetical protein